MAFYDPIKERLKFVRSLTPTKLAALAGVRLSDLVTREAVRSRKTVEVLQQRYPSAGPRELAQRLIDDKKGIASMVGGVSGVFGLVTLPLDLVAMMYLQLMLLTDLATLFKVNLKAEPARSELLDLFGYSNGIGPMQRSSPKVLGKLAAVLLERGGLQTVGRAMPLVAAPISAYLNNLHIQQVGDDALRHYSGFSKAHQKSKKAKVS